MSEFSHEWANQRKKAMETRVVFIQVTCLSPNSECVTSMTFEYSCLNAWVCVEGGVCMN